MTLLAGTMQWCASKKILSVDFCSPGEEGFYKVVLAFDGRIVEGSALGIGLHLVHIAAVCQKEATDVCVAF